MSSANEVFEQMITGDEFKNYPFDVPMLFCNIGWMHLYQGQNTEDQLIGGGKFPVKNKRGHEMCNFYPYENVIYGFVPTKGMRLGRLSARDHRANYVEGVDVIWTAVDRYKNDGQTVIVGWYRNATVYREYQQFDNNTLSTLHKEQGIDGYRIKADKENCFLLPYNMRELNVPRMEEGFLGISNIWYADSDLPNVKEYRERVRKYIEESEKLCLIKMEDNINKVNKNITDYNHNLLVEKNAIERCSSHYISNGYSVKSVEKDNCGWDLEATKKDKTLCIEVKGLSGETAKVGLTPNEYNAFKKQDENYRLAIIVNALSKETKLFICKFKDNEWKINNREVKLSIQEVESAYITLY